MSAAQEYDKYCESESDSDYDSGLDEEMVFSKLLYRSMQCLIITFFIESNSFLSV